MQVRRVNQEPVVFGDPGSVLWSGFPARKVGLVGAPVGLQPSKYVQGKWRDGEFGQTRAAGLQVVHDGREVAFRLEWECARPVSVVRDNDEFADAAALLFPLSESAPLMMGAEGAPVSLWHWRADRGKAARVNVAEGIGTSRLQGRAVGVETQAVHAGGRWSVVFRRVLAPQGAGPETVSFAVGGRYRVAVAVWSGAGSERAGLKAFSPEWVELELEA